MILNATIAAKVIRKGLVQAPSISETHSLEYLESEISNAIEWVTIREIVANIPPMEIISTGKEVCIFEITAIPINNSHLYFYLAFDQRKRFA